MLSIRIAALFLPLPFLAPTTLAQGSHCFNATQISGTWTTWDSTHVAGASGLPVSACSVTSNLNDRFYHWTAERSGYYQVYSESQQPYISLEFFQGGGCLAPYLGCLMHGHTEPFSNFNLGFLNAGDSITVRPVGVFGSSVFGFAFMGDTCQGFTDDAMEPNQYCHQAIPIGNGTYSGLGMSSALTNWHDFFSLSVAPGDTLQVEMSRPADSEFAQMYLRLREFDSELPGCGQVSGGDLLQEQGFAPMLSYQNTGTTNKQFYLFGTWSPRQGCLTYQLDITGANGSSAPVVSTFCDPMDANSTGSPTVLQAVTGSGIHSGIRLEALNGPPGQFASMIVGNAFTEPGIMLGQGRFCLGIGPGEQFGRYNVGGTVLNSIGMFNELGAFQNLVGTSAAGLGFDVPTVLPGFGVRIEEGSTWYFQMWTRDVGGQSNWSNGVSVDYTSLP